MTVIPKSLFVAAALLMFVGHAADAREKVPPEWKALVQSFDTIAAQDHIVGASIALVQDGRLVDQHNYGFENLEARKPVDGDTLFHWASITKTLAAIAIMQLRDDGKLTLDDRVVDYIPELQQVHNPFGPMSDIKLGMLLDHSAGFQAPTWPYKKGQPWEPFEPTRWGQLVAMMPYQQIAFAPGTRFGYSNPGYIYLARILEQKTGDPWEAYIHKNIFLPLGMSRSYFRHTPYHLREHRSHNYTVRPGDDGAPQVTDNGAEFDPGITVPNGGWNAPIADVAAYMGFLMGAPRGQTDLQRKYDTVLARKSLEEMWQPHHAVSEDGQMQMGFAFFIRGTGEQRVIGHTGGQANFSTMIYFNPATRRGVIAAFNTENRLDPNTRPAYFRTTQQRVFELLQ